MSSLPRVFPHRLGSRAAGNFTQPALDGGATYGVYVGWRLVAQYSAARDAELELERRCRELGPIREVRV